MARRRRKRQRALAGAAEGLSAHAATLSPQAFASHAVNEAIPADWHERAKKAWEYFTEEPLVAHVINTWRIFAVGDEVRVTADDDNVEAEANETFARLDLNRWVKDMVLQLLVKGDCIGYVNPNQDGGDLAKVTCVNPVSVHFKFEAGRMVGARQLKEIAPGVLSTPDDGIELDLANLFHAKWNAPEFSPRGNSMVLPAFESLALLKDYRAADRAIAKRWATPFRLIQVGGHYGQNTIKPDAAMLKAVRDMVNAMDMRAGLVVPFWVKAETYGIDGIVLDTEAKVREVKDDVLVALGMARGIVTGDGPNFATASVSMQKMVGMLKELKQVARDMLAWVFEAWKAKRGFSDAELTFHFSDLDLHNETDMKRLLMELYDRGLISKKTLQTKMGLDPAVEDSGKEDESIVVDSNWSVQDVTQLVALEILTPDEAREYLGLGAGSAGGGDNGDATARAALSKVKQLYARKKAHGAERA